MMTLLHLSRRMCILCHNEELLTEATSVFVLCAFVQRSTVMAQNRKHHLKAVSPQNQTQYKYICRPHLFRSYSQEKHQKPRDDLISRHPLFLRSDLPSAPHVASCGHSMHSTCWKKHIDGIMAKERRRPYR